VSTLSMALRPAPARSLAVESPLKPRSLGSQGRCPANRGKLIGEQPPQVVQQASLTHRERRRRHSQGKSDIVDAVAVARIVASGEVFPSARLVETLADLRVLVDYRDQLVRARTQVANRALADLVNIRPRYQREIPNLRAKVHRAKARSLVRGDRSVRAELIRRHLGELSRLEGEIAAMDQRIEAMVRETRTSLTAIPGVGPLIAAKISASGCSSKLAWSSLASASICDVISATIRTMDRTTSP
jgi:transposase